MKKILMAGLMALGLVLTSRQQSQAWVNSKFSIGLSWDWQSGGNSFFWGLINGGQPPCPQFFGHGQPMMPMYAPAYQPAPYYVLPQAEYYTPPVQQPQWTPPAPKTQQPENNIQYRMPPVYPATYYYTPASYYAPAYAYPAYWYGR